MHALGESHSTKKVKYLLKWKNSCDDVIRLVGNALVSDFFNVKKTALSADVRFAQVLWTIDNSGAHCECDSIVVRFTHSSNA